MTTAIVLSLLDAIQQVVNLTSDSPPEDMLPQAAVTADLEEAQEMQRRDWARTEEQPWEHAQPLDSVSFRCGYCGNDVAPDKGWRTGANRATIRICPQCNAPTFFSSGKEQWPGPLLDGDVPSLPDNVRDAYHEARMTMTVNAFTGAVMLCRKILMHVAVDKGAEENQSFKRYVGWLVREHYVPKGGEGWLGYVKDRGNEANHEIPNMTAEDAKALLEFTEALLRNVYSLPAAVPKTGDDAP